MEEEWRDIEGYPNYSVSNLGRIVSHTYDKVMSTQVNNMGIEMIGLVQNYIQKTRSVAILVATAWVDGYSDIFNCPINLNGNRTDNRAANLMWRPRWFAVKYHKQFKDERFLNASPHIIDLETGSQYHSLREPAQMFGLLADDIEKSVVNRVHCFPNGKNFRRIDETY